MEIIDWTIVTIYVVTSLAIGLAFSKFASRSSEDFFLAGRTLPWYIAGTSMVATSFSSDTPLFVAGTTRSEGIYANWFWWSAAVGMLVSIFFFARLWRRTEAVTEVQFVTIRYGDNLASKALRIFKSFYDGVLINTIIIASVTLAMSKIIVSITDIKSDAVFTFTVFGSVTQISLILLILALAAVLYTLLSGLYGVVYTDLIQFSLALAGSIALAVIVYIDLSKGPGFVANLSAAVEFNPTKLHFVPDITDWNRELFAFIILVVFGWWYQAPGSGHVVQRMLASRSEKDAALSAAWFVFCHFVLRSWPWLIVGLASLVYFPSINDAEAAYPLMIDKFLPTGIKGIMVASLLAAFMSTFDTQLNWGTSYLVNDVYKPFLRRNEHPRHYVKVSRLVMIGLVVLSILLSTMLTGILAAYKYLIVLYSGMGFVSIARWYWWRINAWSEIATIITSLIAGNITFILLPDTENSSNFAIRILITVIVCTAACVTISLFFNRSPDEAARKFYSKMQIPGPGWKKLRRDMGIVDNSGVVRYLVLGWLSSVVLLFSTLLGIGFGIFAYWTKSGLCSGLGLIALWPLWYSIRRTHIFE